MDRRRRPLHLENYSLRSKQGFFRRRHLNLDSVEPIVGAIETNKEHIPDVVSQALQFSRIGGRIMRIFYRLMKKGILYTSELYRRSAKTNSMNVKYHANGRDLYFGVIHCFVKVSNCNCRNFCQDDCNARYYAIVKQMRTVTPFSIRPEATLSYIRHFTLTNTVNAVEVSNLLMVCFLINIEQQDIKYIIEPVNYVEFE